MKYFLTLIIFISLTAHSQEPTYAERLGFPKGAKVVIMHVDDVGMSWDSNEGAIQAIEKGVATSWSIMMPCPWVPAIAHYLKDHPNVDAGLHLTFTSEWKEYRWGPLSGKPATPGLVDSEGAMWPSVADVVNNASADEVEKEIRAQLERARSLGINPTHLDSHMGTLFASPEFLQRYVKVGVENKIPVMFFGGHSSMIASQIGFPAEVVQQFRETGKLLWNSGLPVLDDLHNVSYDFAYPKEQMTDDQLQKFATTKYIESFSKLKPGLTMVIMHCSKPSEVFQYISDSGTTRKGDMLAMTDPELKKYLEKEKIVLTTWREVMTRRANLKSQTTKSKK